MKSTCVLIPLLTLGLVGCGDLLITHQDPSNDALSNFDHVWNDFDQLYAFFEQKGIDWNQVRAEYRPRVTPTTSAPELFLVLTEMLGRLRDGHANLVAPDVGHWEYDGWFRDAPANFNEATALARVTSVRSVRDGALQYGRIGHDVGYLRLGSFAGQGWGDEIDAIIASLSTTSGIIIDIRDNFGGLTVNADLIASRFADRERIYARVRYRNGPRHDDFTEWMNRYVTPGGKVQYRGPVIVLTNRRVFSAAESFVLEMRALPNVRIVGDTTGGGSGSPITRELPSGWTYRVSRWQETPPNGVSYEGIGIAPDHAVQITAADERRMHDTILEFAINLLR